MHTMRHRTIARFALTCAVAYVVAHVWPGSPCHAYLLGFGIPTDYMLGGMLGLYLTR